MKNLEPYILLVLVGLTAGRQSDEILVDFENSLWIASVRFLQCLTKVQCYYSVTNAF